MSDELDRLTENEQVILDQQIQQARNSAAAQLPINGHCHYCQERIGDKKFCDEYCSQDWHEERAARLRNHGVYRSAD